MTGGAQFICLWELVYIKRLNLVGKASNKKLKLKIRRQPLLPIARSICWVSSVVALIT